MGKSQEEVQHVGFKAFWRGGRGRWGRGRIRPGCVSRYQVPALPHVLTVVIDNRELKQHTVIDDLLVVERIQAECTEPHRKKENQALNFTLHERDLLIDFKGPIHFINIDRSDVIGANWRCED